MRRISASKAAIPPLISRFITNAALHNIGNTDSAKQANISMTDRFEFDDIEKKFGIAAYASPHEGFAAVVKARYSDFIVHEVDMDGNIARLERLEVPKDTSKQSNNATDAEDPEGSDRKRAKIESSTDATSEPHAENSPADENAPFDWDKCKQELNKFIDETAAHEAVDFLKSKSNDEPPKDDDTKFYILPAITDKETRRSIHQYIKSPAISSIARADNHEGRIRIWHVKYQSGMPADTFGRANGGEGAGRNNRPSKKKAADRPAWPKDRPDFLRFVLYKENVDTHTALKDVVRSGRLNPKRGVSFAGMKDKRGVTTQFCSVYRTEKEQLLALNSHRIGAGGGNSTKGGFNIIRVGNFSYSGEEVKLGSLNGNRFDIVLRNVDIGDVADDPTQKAKLVKERLEAAAMGLRQVGFINYFGMQRFGKSNDTHEVGIAILKGDYETALDIIMREKDTDEPPRQAEARKKWMNRFKSIDVANDEDGAKAAEMKCAKSILNDLGRFLGVEKSVIGSLLKHPRDYKRAYTSIAKNMRSMYLHAYQSYLWNHVVSHRIESGGSIEVRAGDLVLINDKTLSEGGSGTSGLKGKEVKVLSDDDVATGQYSITDVVLPLVGSKIRYPEGSSGDMLNKLLQKDGISKDAFAKIGSIDREIALGGDYRKVMCRPSDVSFEVLTYKDPRQPLIQTDLMKVMGTEIDAVPIDVNSVNKPTSAPDDKHAVEEEKTEEEADVVFGMVVGFSLPPSSYATIALRELTKRPTSSDYQSKLELSGRCERNHITV